MTIGYVGGDALHVVFGQIRIDRALYFRIFGDNDRRLDAQIIYNRFDVSDALCGFLGLAFRRVVIDGAVQGYDSILGFYMTIEARAGL